MPVSPGGHASAPPLRAVLDLNVLVPGVLGVGLGRRSPPVTALLAGLEHEYRPVASPRLLDQLHTVLQRPKFALGAELADRWADLIGSAAEIVRTRGDLRVLKRDLADNAVLEVALRATTQFLVTGNRRHFAELASGGGPAIVYRGVHVVTPREFIERALGGSGRAY